MNERNATPGSMWYGCTCKVCARFLPLFEHEDPKAQPVKFVGEGNLSVMCPHCHDTRMYHPDELMLRTV